jgi:hypothetical protein
LACCREHARSADAGALIFSEAQNLQAKVRTTDATATQLARWTLSTLTGYDVELRLLAVDSANGVIKKIVADLTLERLNAGALLIGQTVLASHQSTGAPATTSGVANWAVSPVSPATTWSLP